MTENKSAFYIYLPGGRMLCLKQDNTLELEYFTFEYDDFGSRRDTLELTAAQVEMLFIFAYQTGIEIPFEPDGRTVVGWSVDAYMQKSPSPTAFFSPTGEISRVI